jgi:hypothetical protein
MEMIIIMFFFSLYLLCTTIHDMCTQEPSHNYSQQLSDKYQVSFEDYITSMVNKILYIYVLLHLLWH